MQYANYPYYFVFLMLFSCNSETSPSYAVGTGESNPESKKMSFDRPRDGFNKAASGLYYAIHTNNGMEKAKLNDYLVADMSYATEGGHDIFSKKDLTFKFSRSLFSGALNEGLQMMGTGDRASFIIPANKVYLKEMPDFVGEGEGIVYEVTIHKILDSKGYKQHMKARSQSSKPIKVKK